MAISGGDGSIILTTKVDESGLSKGLSKLKSGVGAFGKAFAVAGAAGVAAFAGITKAAVDSYAEFEQLKGGVETLFKDSADVLMRYADKAYQTAGLSANDYMETVTSFSASLLQSLGGDTAAAADYADQAVIDMSDNANKMGTSMEMIQNAYQGFAKQNYTMLDNLKLGYGGTKEEMQRLLDDAEKISGIKYDISSFADVTQAIHVIQTELGITGTTALEASSTIQGSANAMKASWQNLLTGMADPTQDFDVLLQNFISSVGTFAGNLLPVIQTAAQGVLQMIQGLLPQLGNMVTQMLPMLVQGISEVLSTLYSLYPQIVQSILSILPQLIQAVSQLIVQVANQLPQLMQVIVSALPTVIQSIVSALPTIIPPLINGIVQAIVILAAALPQIIQPIIDNLPMIITAITGALIGNLPILIQGAIQLVVALVAALPQIIMALLEAMGGIAVQIGNALFKALPGPVQNAFKAAFDAIKAIWDKVQPYFAVIWEGIKAVFSVVGAVLGGFFSTAWTMIKAVWDTVTGYFSAIWDTIAGIFSVVASVLSGNWSDAWEAIKGIVNTWANFFSGVWESIKSVFSAVGSWFTGIFSAAWNGIKNVWSAVGSFFSGIINTIKSIFQQLPSQLIAIGKNMVNGLWNGIQNSKNWLLGKIKQWCGSILNGIKSFFGIHSPSTVMRDEVGKQIPAGMAIGIDKAKNLVTKATQALVTDTRSEVQKVLDDMNEEMLESEKLYAEESIRLKDSTVEADKEYLDNLKNTAEKERKIYDARQKDIQNAQKNIVNAYENAADDILDAIKDLQNRQQTLADKLIDFGGVMEDVVEIEDKFSDIHSPITEKDGRYVLESLGYQTWELERYLGLMTKLRDREGMSAELFDVIKNMGYEESLAYAQQLMRMGDKQFSNYIESWQKKQETSKRITEELFGDDGSIGAKRVLSDLTNQTNVLKDYYSLLEDVKNRAELPEGFFDTLRDMGIEEGLEYANALLELSDEDFAKYIKAWEEKQKTSQLISKELYKDEAEQLANEIGDKFDEVEKEFFDVGENAADQFESGFLEQLKTVVSNIKGTISGAFSNVGLGMSPNYGIGGYSINVPALARGSVLPGGKPFLAIVNDQPRGQTNVEAPLQTIVDAMNIALNNRGGSEIIREEHYNLNETELMTILHKLVKGGERLQGKSLISGGAY